jgi:hypothetical protein
MVFNSAKTILPSLQEQLLVNEDVNLKWRRPKFHCN